MPWNAPSRPHPTRMVGVAEPLGISYLPRRRGYREGPPARKPTPRLITTAQRWFRRSAGNTPRRSVCCRTTRCTLSACMQGATECQVSRRRPIPLVIRASIRVPRCIMAVPKAGGSRRRRRPLVAISATRKPASQAMKQTVNPCCGNHLFSPARSTAPSARIADGLAVNDRPEGAAESAPTRVI
jgi:hypothetical protein